MKIRKYYYEPFPNREPQKRLFERKTVKCMSVLKEYHSFKSYRLTRNEATRGFQTNRLEYFEIDCLTDP